MLKIDAHQHFWHYDAGRHSWISDEMAFIRKDFLPEDLLPELHRNGMDGCIAVQTDQTETETDFLLAVAHTNDFIKGVVGWIDMRADNAAERLQHYAAYEQLKGFRHILQGEDPSFMLQADFLKGIALLQQFDFTYDILISPEHLPAVLQLVQRFPQQAFVLDHMAKPVVKRGVINQWAKDITILAACQNVYCKVSGMVTEADMRKWQPSDFKPYLDVVVKAFGINRLLYGSDWPVCLAAGSYSGVFNIVKDYFSAFSTDEQQSFFGKNAAAFYQV